MSGKGNGSFFRCLLVICATHTLFMPVALPLTSLYESHLGVCTGVWLRPRFVVGAPKQSTVAGV